MSLSLQSITFPAACAFVDKHHRHHKPPRGWKFGVSVVSDQTVVGVAMVGRPVARMLDNGTTLEVLRCCTDGTKNVASMLYGACWRAAQALGYQRLITYTLSEEHGTSLLASGWKKVADTAGGSWSRESRKRDDNHPIGPKQLWEAA